MIEAFMEERGTKVGKCVRFRGDVIWKGFLHVGEKVPQDVLDGCFAKMDRDETLTIETWADIRADTPTSTITRILEPHHV